MARKTEPLISVDIEADGPIPGPYSMASIGACVIWAKHKTFKVELKPISDQFDQKAVEIMAAGGLIRDDLLVNGVEASEAMRRFKAWMDEVCGTNHKPVLVARNAPFDWMFVYWYFVNFLGIKPFGISALDSKAYLMGLLRLERWDDTVASKIPEEFRSDYPHTHDCLDDAIEQADCFEKMLAYAAEQKRKEIQG